jgi:hypothetical protein
LLWMAVWLKPDRFVCLSEHTGKTFLQGRIN